MSKAAIVPLAWVSKAKLNQEQLRAAIKMLNGLVLAPQQLPEELTDSLRRCFLEFRVQLQQRPSLETCYRLLALDDKDQVLQEWLTRIVEMQYQRESQCLSVLDQLLKVELH